MHRAFVVFLASFLPLAAAAQDVVRLPDLEVYALAHRPDLEAGSARVRAAGAMIDRAEGGRLPTVGVGVNGSLAPGRDLIQLPGTNVLVQGSRELGDPGAFTPKPRYGATLGLKGSLYDFGRTSSAVEAARAQQSAAHADVVSREQQILREVRGTYLRWAGAFALLQLAREAVALARANEQRVAALIEEGARPDIDRTSAAQQTAITQLDAERAAEDADAARLDLAFVSGKTLADTAEPDSTLLASAGQSLTSRPPTASVSQGPADQPDAAALALDSARAAAEAKARMHEHSESAVLGYDADTGVSGQSDHVFPVYSVGIRLSVPIYDGGTTKAGAAEARAQAAALAAEASAARAQTAHGASRARLAGDHALRRLTLANESLRLAEAQLAQLDASGALDAEAFQARTSAEAARARAKTEVVLAQLACVQARYGLVSP